MKKPQPIVLPIHRRVPVVHVSPLSYVRVADMAAESAAARIFLQHLQPRSYRPARKMKTA